MKWFDMLQGSKTYIVALATVAYGVWMGVTGGMPWPEVVNYVLGGSALASVRSAMDRVW